MEGLDSEGNSCGTRRNLWSEQAGTDLMRKQWYQKGVNYWSGVEPSENGVLGGYGNISPQDIVDSDKFLLDCFETLVPDHLERKLVALDCGAGVGRVTKHLLIRHFDEVDLVEPVEQFLSAARQSLQPEFDQTGVKKVKYYLSSLQNFVPEVQRFDVIWIQWCIGHLTDVDVLAFLNRAKAALKPGGFIVLKENIAKSGFVLDKVDSSVTRSDEYFRDLFKDAGLFLFKERMQTEFPQELFSVHMYCLTTESHKMTLRRKPKQVHRYNMPGIIK